MYCLRFRAENNIFIGDRYFSKNGLDLLNEGNLF